MAVASVVKDGLGEALSRLSRPSNEREERASREGVLLLREESCDDPTRPLSPGDDKAFDVHERRRAPPIVKLELHDAEAPFKLSS